MKCASSHQSKKTLIYYFVVFSLSKRLRGAEMPKFNESDAMGRAGVHEVGVLISEMRWIFREQAVADTGIDGYIEPCDENGNASGKLIGCQVKPGPSYFR